MVSRKALACISLDISADILRVIGTPWESLILHTCDWYQAAGSSDCAIDLFQQQIPQLIPECLNWDLGSRCACICAWGSQRDAPGVIVQRTGLLVLGVDLLAETL